MQTNNKSLFILLMAMAFVFAVQSSSYAAPKAPIVYVAWDGKGDYNCDGKADQEQINEALKFVASNDKFTTVYLKGKHTYWIDEPLVIPSNIKLTGDSTAKVQLIDGVKWPGNKPMVRQEGEIHWKDDDLGVAIYGTKEDKISNVEISGFEISGGKQKLPHGRWYVILIMFNRAYNIKIHDMNLNNACGDIIRIFDNGEPRSKNIKIYNNKLHSSGHEGMYLLRIKNLKIYNNEITLTETNAGMRVADCTNILIYGNTIGNSYDIRPSGYAGIYLSINGYEPDTAEIYDNYVYGKTVGILVYVEYQGMESKFVHIHHNRIFKIAHFKNRTDLQGGIRIIGVRNALVEYNTIEGSVKDGIIFEFGNVGVKTKYNEKGEDIFPGKFKTTVRNNIITNCGGYGITNFSNTGKHKFDISNNNIYNCKDGDYHNVNIKSEVKGDTYEAVKYVNTEGAPDKIDLHLVKPSSSLAKKGAYGSPIKGCEKCKKRRAASRKKDK